MQRWLLLLVLRISSVMENIAKKDDRYQDLRAQIGLEFRELQKTINEDAEQITHVSLPLLDCWWSIARCGWVTQLFKLK